MSDEREVVVMLFDRDERRICGTDVNRSVVRYRQDSERCANCTESENLAEAYR